MANLANSDSYGYVNGTAGDDKISNSGQYSTVNAGDGNDTIYNSGITHWSQLEGGAGNDSIYNEQGNYITIRGGKGDDTIRIKSLYANNNIIQYDEGDGNDYFIDEYNPSSPNWTVQIGGGTGTYSTQTSGSDLIVNVGSGKITLANMGSKSVNIAGTYSTGSGGVTVQNGNAVSLVSGTSYADSIFNYGNSVTVNTGAGDDTVVNATGGYNSYIYGGDGNDSVLNASFSDTIYGGDGNDTIKSGDSSRVYGGTGNDFIYVASGDAGRDTISGGTGNDIISLGGTKGSNGY